MTINSEWFEFESVQGRRSTDLREVLKTIYDLVWFFFIQSKHIVSIIILLYLPIPIFTTTLTP